MPNFEAIFSEEALQKLFPPQRTDDFFEALFGDAEEGAYDIRLVFTEGKADRLLFAFELHERPGKCLACNLTYGLPEVFSRHPIIAIKELVAEIDALLDGKAHCCDWKLGPTSAVSKKLYRIPLEISLSS